MKKLLLLVFSIVLIAGCVQTAVPAAGLLEMRITDAPGNITSLDITISLIEAHRAETTTTSIINVTNETTNETIAVEVNETITAGWIILLDEEKTFDLIAISGVEEVLGNATLDAGKYTQIRMTVSSAVGVIDGEEKDITVPSSKLKFIHPFIIEANQTTVLLFDFDAEKSVVQAGNSGKYNLKPVVKLITK